MNIPNGPANVQKKTFFPIILSGVGMMLVSSLLALANPKPEAYAEYVVWKFNQTTCQQRNLPPMTQVSCASLSMVPHQFSQQILENYIHREDYGVFSVYSIDALGLSDQSIGVGGRFFNSSQFWVDPEAKSR